MTRRRVIALAVALLPIAAVRGETALPRPVSLRDAAGAAAARGEPFVLLFSLPGCPYCEQVRHSHLLQLARELGGGVFQIDVGSAAPVVDVDGMTRTQDAVATALQARLTPTLLFLGPGGAELSERLVGAGIPDFYGALLEQRLEQARLALRPR
ncbi:MAG TPA: thioredoxin fold domain-containing protein [Caldimonas sp.]